jgi:hypothetical protein
VVRVKLLGLCESVYRSTSPPLPPCCTQSPEMTHLPPYIARIPPPHTQRALPTWGGLGEWSWGGDVRQEDKPTCKTLPKNGKSGAYVTGVSGLHSGPYGPGMSDPVPSAVTMPEVGAVVTPPGPFFTLTRFVGCVVPLGSRAVVLPPSAASSSANCFFSTSAVLFAGSPASLHRCCISLYGEGGSRRCFVMTSR